MSAATYSTISLIGYIAAGVFLAAAVVLFFVFKIPTVIGDLSGRTARKSIAKQRAANESSGSKSFRPSEGNVARGKITESMPDAKKQKAKPPAAPGQAAPQRPAAPAPQQRPVPRQRPVQPVPQQRPAAPQRPGAPVPNADPMLQGTGMYEENKIRGVASAETEMLSDLNETVALDEGNTTVSLNEPTAPAAAPAGGKQLTMVNEVMLIHTDEVI